MTCCRSAVCHWLPKVTNKFFLHPVQFHKLNKPVYVLTKVIADYEMCPPDMKPSMMSFSPLLDMKCAPGGNLCAGSGPRLWLSSSESVGR